MTLPDPPVSDSPEPPPLPSRSTCNTPRLPDPPESHSESLHFGHPSPTPLQTLPYKKPLNPSTSTMNCGNSEKPSMTTDRTKSYSAALTNSLLNTLIPTSTPQKETHPSPPPSVGSSSDPRIALPPAVLSSIQSRWEKSLIIKLTGKSLDSNHLSTSLRSLWKCKLPIKLVGLGKGFYSCSIGNKEDLQNIKSNGPWFIHGHYLHVQEWKPNFQASLARIKSVPTWIILPELPIEYHRSDVLQAIGNSLGGFIKHDQNGLNRNNARCVAPAPSLGVIRSASTPSRPHDLYPVVCSNQSSPPLGLSGPACPRVPAGSLTNIASIERNLFIELDFQGPPGGELHQHCETVPHCNADEATRNLDKLGQHINPKPLGCEPDAQTATHDNVRHESETLQGIARPSFSTHLSYLINAHKPNIVILSETRVNSPNSLTIVQRLPFDSFEVLDPVGFAGGIIILWNAGDVAVTLVNKGAQLINVVVQVVSTNFTFLLSAIYASPKFKYRRNLWNELITLSHNLRTPWVCVGDFNEVTCAGEKIGGNGIKLNRVSLFSSSMNICNLIDIGFSGPKFTWTNRRRLNPILERLDRVGVNQLWLDQYPNSHNYHLTRLSSDHCPILLKTTLTFNPLPKPFKFESFWLADPGFLPLISSAWPVGHQCVTSKLSSLSLVLSNWAKETFGSLTRKKNTLNARLLGTQRQLCTHPRSEFLLNLNDSLLSDLNRVLDLEHAYWKDRARINWLLDGDRNTSFFQKSVTLRRSFNRIISLFNEVGQTITNQDDLVSHITCFFTKLYSSEKCVVIIVNRLKPFMHTIISPNQGSSIPGRGTDSNFIIASEILHSMHYSKSKIGWFALKLDHEKAFDRLEWDFIHSSLIHARIDPDTISLIMSCISTSSSHVLFNGSPSAAFQPSRGIRQGDPLSPYLFIICMEALSTLIHQSCLDRDWTPFPLGKGGVTFSHLLFADDILLFGRSSEQNLCALQDTLLSFSSSSGQKINCLKSKIVFSKHTPIEEITMFEASLGIKSTKSLGTYLGFPLTWKKPKRSELQPILDAIQSKLANWKTQFLSKAGRLCLIKSTINAIPSHTMQCIRLPSSMLNDIDKTTRSFLWSGQSSKKLHLTKWDLVTQSIALGGLGIKASRQLNNAFSTKLCWKLLLDNTSVASAAIKSKYLNSSSTPFRYGSHIWKNVGTGWPILKNHLTWSIGDGSTISLWNDQWSSLGTLRSIISGPLTSLSSEARLSTIISNGQWSLESLEFILPDRCIEIIRAIPLPSSPKSDVLTISLAPKNKFSLGSTYASLFDLFTRPPSFSIDLLWLWGLRTQPKIKLFLWLAWWDKLPHNLTLHKRSILPSPCCTLCDSPSLNESSIHILRDCSFAGDVWSQFNVSHGFFSLDLQPWLHENCTSADASWSTLFSFIIWRLWLRRCDLIFSPKPFTPPSLLCNAISAQASAWISANHPVPSTTPNYESRPSASRYPSSWAPPPHDWLKVNVDAAFSSSSLFASIGCVARTSDGSWVRGWSTRLFGPSPFICEVLAIREGLRFASWSTENFLIASDCSNAVNVILSRDPPCGPYTNIILECREQLKASPRLKLVFEKRSANKVADAIAKASSKDTSSCNDFLCGILPHPLS
ncbi:uncharacterized protein LOC141601774 [Silene latifolia]|uniref:uncharacterized protein LOC141601774 n=1 Tax=Silene latifolia TaxID=37657 RepID=UPI003D76F242